VNTPVLTDPAVGGQRSVRYVLPFALFLALLALFAEIPLPSALTGPGWLILFVPLSIACWPREISVVPRHWVSSTVIGLVVFALWIAPDVLVPGYRHSLLFSNALLGHLHSSLPAAPLRTPLVLAWRTARAVIVVPIVEELFWRAWLMRWLINPNFERVPLGSYSVVSFWLTAILFASEHGPYWDVGLIAGLIYNWWMIRSKSLADCILMHAITNLALSIYVIGTAQWQYWQ
jgi:uncharacterized protein